MGVLLIVLPVHHHWYSPIIRAFVVVGTIKMVDHVYRVTDLVSSALFLALLVQNVMHPNRPTY
jgi:hypothetical protein